MFATNRLLASLLGVAMSVSPAQAAGRGFQFPSGSTQVTIPAEAFRRIAVPTKLTRLYRDPAYVGATQKIKAALDRLANQRSPAKTVVYFFSGFDAGLPARLFPDAEVIIGATDNPFDDALNGYRAPAAGSRTYFNIPGRSFYSSSQVGEMGPIWSKIVGELHAAVPHFRLRSISVGEVPGEQSRTWTQQDSARQANHGIVEFDRGPNTPVQRYVHLDLFLDVGPGSRANYRSTWWMKNIAKLAPDALIVKSAHGSYSNRSRLAKQFLGMLRTNRGILIEGSKYDGQREFSSNFSPFPHTRRAVVRDVAFGYPREHEGREDGAGTAVIHVFDRESPSRRRSR